MLIQSTHKEIDIEIRKFKIDDPYGKWLQKNHWRKDTSAPRKVSENSQKIKIEINWFQMQNMKNTRNPKMTFIPL